MKKLKPLFIIPMLAHAAYANLPDEINYEPYKIQYDRLSADVDVISTNLGNAENDLQNAYNNESRIQNSIQNIQNENVRLNHQIDQMIADRQALTIQADQLTDVVNDLERRINRAQNRRERIESNIDQEKRRLRPLRQRLARIEENLNRANQEVDNARRVFRRGVEARDRIQGEVQSLKSSLDSMRASKKQKEDQLANIETQISETQARLATMRGNLENAKTKKDAEVAKSETLKAELKTLQAEMRAIIQEVGGGRGAMSHPRFVAKRQEVQAKQAEIRQQAKNIQAATTRVTQIEKRVNGVQTALQNLKRSKQTLPGEIAGLKTRIDSTKSSLASKRQQLRAANENVAEKESILNENVMTANRIAGSRIQALDNLARESKDLEDYLVRLDEINERIRIVGEDLRVNSNALNSTMQSLDIIDRDLPVVRRNVADNRRELNNLDNQLITVQNSIIALSETVDQLRSEQSTAIVARDRKYQEYISRLDYYNQKLSEAKQLGASQTDVALSLGRSDGNNYVATRANQLGGQIGMNLADAQAAYWSNVRAEIKGYNDGYATGYASEIDQIRGIQEGNAAGRAAADTYANTTLQPQFFNQMFAAKLEGQNMSFEPLKSASSEEIERIETQIKELRDILVGVSTVTAAEIRDSLNISSGLDSQVAMSKSNLSEVVALKDSTGVAGNVYEAAQSIPYQTVDCSNVYKNVAEYAAACENSYYSTFESSYKAERFSTFSAQYNGLYNAKVQDIRDANIEALYDLKFEQAYPIAEASGISDGKKKIYEEAYATAYESGYSSQLPTATNMARGQAREEVNDYIANNATLTLKQASIQGSELMGGSKARVNLEMKNISPKALTSPVIVRITGTKNANPTQREYSILNAAGNTTTDFNGISFEVDSTARSNQPIELEGEIILNGGKYQARRVEKFKVNAVTAINPALNTDYQYDSTPKVVNWRNRTLVHTINITNSAKVENLRDGYTINMSAMPGSKDLIVIKTPSIRTGTLSTGRATQSRLQYTLWLKGIGKTVNVKLDYLYKGKKIKSKIIELRPR